MSNADRVIREFMSISDENEAKNLMRFFKTGKAEYGEGDIFLGIRVPKTRSIVRKYKNIIGFDDIPTFIDSPYHEIRLAGFLFLIEIYEQAKKAKDEKILKNTIDYYLSTIDRGNNWDLVDPVSYKLLGDWLIINPDKRYILDQMAEMHGALWHQRVSIVTTFAFIRNGEFDDTLRIAEKLLGHDHDLIHKATGWMLREVGKHGGKKQLIKFLDKYSHLMPRTMLRYALEKFPQEERNHYMKITY